MTAHFLSKYHVAFCAFGLVLQFAQAGKAAPAQTFTVTGAVSKPATWSVAQLRRTFTGSIKTVRYTLKGKAHTAHAVPLIAILQQAHPRLNPHIKNHQLQLIVEVQGHDGYTADFTLADLLPTVGSRKVWVALDIDNQPLDDESGPVELISPEDKKPGRWVHSVASITVVDMAQPVTPSAAP